MYIRPTAILERDALLGFVLSSQLGLTAHPFFRRLTVLDRKYLTAFARTLPKTEYTRTVFLPSGRQILLLHLGERSKYNPHKVFLLPRQAVRIAKKEKIRKLEVCLSDLETFFAGPVQGAQMIATQLELANFEFNRYKTPPADGWDKLETAYVFYPRRVSAIATALKNGWLVGEETNAARTLSNTPGGDMTPARLATAAVSVGRKYGIRVSILRENQMKKLKMGGVLAVARGSTEKPRFIIMEYLRGKQGEKPTVLVGKGITFDTGGLNLKPGDSIYEMHMDMSGGAAVIHALAALARLKVKKNLVGLIPAAENMPSGSSYHPGDLLRTMSGKTIEVLNTDAEGRIVLADALTYAKRYHPRLVIDVATLTGAAVVALGQRASAVFATDEKIQNLIRASGERTGEFVWPLPLWTEYEENIKGTFGDVANTGNTRYGGAINGAVFLWQFIKDTPWVHLDIAPRMTSIDGEYLARGSTGTPVPLLVDFITKF